MSMKPLPFFFCLLLPLLVTGTAGAGGAGGTAISTSQPVSSIRGLVLDADTRIPLTGVSVVIAGSNPLIGTVSDENGAFHFQRLPVGRYDLNIYYLGYEPRTVNNILLISGKEEVVRVELTESLIKLDEVTIMAGQHKGEPLNQLAAVSARSFTMEETKRYAGSFHDPARMAASYAGVTADPGGGNEIMIRGNSPRGLQWRLEGVEIPSPNHFSEEGATGGPISILNSTTLDHSDFLTGAFPAEYGNALSGVFDLNLRKGNNEKREYKLQVGMIGFEGAAEGPLIRGGNASFLVNYRYSTLAMFNAVGIKIAGDAVPEFQDLTFHLNLPAKKAGTFSIFGLGGISKIYEEYSDWINDFGTDMGVFGVKHLYILNSKTYINTTLAMTASRNNWWHQRQIDSDAFQLTNREHFTYWDYRGSIIVNHKINPKHYLKTGFTYDDSKFDLFTDFYDRNDSVMVREVDQKGRTGHWQAYASWRCRITGKLSLNTGLHFLYFSLNGNYSVEPRVGIRWQFTPAQSISAGAGIHSRLETLTNYLAERELGDGTVIQPNKHLEISKARHYVIGYQNNISKHFMIKGELYYQDLYDVPIEEDPTSSFSALNYAYGITTMTLGNGGTGRNYGVELTLEKFFSRTYYFLITSSVYQSKYRAGDGIERDSRYNGNYVFNLLGGKEFTLGRGPYPWTLGLGGRIIWAGGQRHTPIDLEASREEGNTVRKQELAWTEQYDDFIRFDFKAGFIKNRNKSTHTIELDIQNVTNRLNIMGDYYDPDEDRIDTWTQMGIIPSLIYRVEF
jgi:hypothetical protein